MWVLEDSGLVNKAYETTGTRCQACCDISGTVDSQVDLCSHCVVCALGTDNSRSNWMIDVTSLEMLTSSRLINREAKKVIQSWSE